MVHGFTLGVALIILGGQLANGLGLRNLPVHGRFYLNIVEVAIHAADSSVPALALFVLSWLSLYFLVQRFPRVPWSIALAGVGICLGYLSHSGRLLPLATLGDEFGSLSASLWSPPPRWPAMLKLWQRPREAVATSLSIAFVSVLESLISGRLADALTHTEMDSRREVLGLAVGNLVAGLGGGIPATAALARTSLSVHSGATSRLAGVINAAMTAALSMFLFPLFAFLPLCVVAALLFQVGVGMMDGRLLRDAYEVDRSSFWLTLLVAALCLLFDPTVAIVCGSLLGLFLQAMQTARGYSEIISNDDEDGDTPPFQAEVQSKVALYRVVGSLDYLSAAQHTARLHRLRHCRFILLSFRFCRHIDVDGLHQLRESINSLATSEHGHPRLLLCAVPPSMQPALCRSDWYLHMLHGGRVFPSVQQAIDSLQGLVSDKDLDTLRHGVLEAHHPYAGSRSIH